MRIRLLLSLLVLAALVFTVRHLVIVPDVKQISAAQLEELLEQGVPLQIVDVREAEEYAAGHIPGALLIPLGELEERMHELCPHTDVVVVCLTGNRSAQATRRLVEEGFRAKNLKGGMVHWQGEVERLSAD